ncbi:hypothetical protein P4478_00445, partial [Bacillus subtilis]|nr:hypothetical protein [Bacillus subtilis]
FIEYIHYYNNIRIQTETKQPITDKLSAIGCLKGVLIPVSKTGVSPCPRKVFVFLICKFFGNNKRYDMIMRGIHGLVNYLYMPLK